MATIYWCPRCNWGQYHPLSWCKFCPGRLEKKKVNSPSYFETTKDITEFLAKHNIKYVGEYPQISNQEENLIRIARYKEFLLEAQFKCIFYSPDGNYYPWRSVEYWKKEIKVLEEQTNGTIT